LLFEKILEIEVFFVLEAVLYVEGNRNVVKRIFVYILAVVLYIIEQGLLVAKVDVLVEVVVALSRLSHRPSADNP
jgi:hypothetical protein